MDNYPIPKKSTPSDYPDGIFKSLALLIGINQSRTKICPFCEESINEEASTCRFCNKILMKQMNLKAKR